MVTSGVRPKADAQHRRQMATTYLNGLGDPQPQDIFAFTIKARRKKDCLLSNYNFIMSKWTLRGAQITKFNTEIDKSGRLHVHGIVKLPSDIQYTSLVEDGYRCWFRRVFNKKGWEDYSHKQDERVPTSVAIQRLIKIKIFKE